MADTIDTSNGWGQGAANNTEGWGQGSCNGEPWGIIHPQTYAHPPTNLHPCGFLPIEGSDYSFLGRQDIPETGGLFTANEVTFLDTNESNIVLDSDIIVTGTFSISWVVEKISGTFYITAIGTSNSNQLRFSNTVVTARIGGGSAANISGFTNNPESIYTLKRNLVSGLFELFENGVLISTEPLGGGIRATGYLILLAQTIPPTGPARLGF